MSLTGVGGRYELPLTDPFFSGITSNKKRWSIEQKLSEIRHPDSAEIEDMNLGRWDSPLFSEKGFHLLGLKAYLSGELSKHTFVKICLYDACQRQEREITKWMERNADRFSGQNLKPKKKLVAHQLINENCDVNIAAEKALRKATQLFFSHNQEQFDQLINQLAEDVKTDRLKPTDTQFFAIKNLEKGSTQYYEGPYDDLFGAICSSFRMIHKQVNPTSKDWAKYFLMSTPPQDRIQPYQANQYTVKWQYAIPPCFVHQILKGKFGKDAVEADEILGFDPNEPMEDPNKRPVYIPFPELFGCTEQESRSRRTTFLTLEKVHGQKGSPLAVYFHDVAYHFAVQSAIPENHRKFWDGFARVLGEHGYEDMKRYMLDKDFQQYLVRIIQQDRNTDPSNILSDEEIIKNVIDEMFSHSFNFRQHEDSVVRLFENYRVLNPIESSDPPGKKSWCVLF